MLRYSSIIACAALILGSAVAALPARAQLTTLDVNPDSVRVDFSNDPAGAIHAARQLIAQGKMAAAIDGLEAYCNSHPGNIAPCRFLGDLYFREGRLKSAELTYLALLRYNSADRITHNRLGSVYAVEGRVDDAIAQFDAALPGTESVGDLVTLHERKGDFATFQAQLLQESRTYPGDPGIQNEVGELYLAIHQPYAASVYYRRALDANAKDLTALNGLGLADMGMHDYVDAKTQFDACIRRDHAAYACIDDLGAALLEAKQYDQAQAMLDRARNLEPERAETYVNFGYLADARGDWHRAVAYYVQAISIDPYLRESYIDLGLAYEQHQLYPLAEAALLKGLAAVVDDGRLHVLLGNAYSALGEKDKAIAQYRLALAGTDPDALRIARNALPHALASTMPPRR